MAFTYTPKYRLKSYLAEESSLNINSRFKIFGKIMPFLENPVVIFSSKNFKGCELE
jgi:hypothetical protein